MNTNLVIGVLGGMGTYATIHVFNQYAEIFPASRENERPRIVIDNNCVMPSRVRAYLYKEDYSSLIEQMIKSIEALINCGCNRIVLACNTSHLFLPQIYEKRPYFKDFIVNIISTCVDSVVEESCKKVYLLGSEATISSQIYQHSLSQYNVDCIYPSTSELTITRNCIEAVKQNCIDNKTKDEFIGLFNDKFKYYILGCTELPVLFEKFSSLISGQIRVYDPIRLALNKIKIKDFK